MKLRRKRKPAAGVPRINLDGYDVECVLKTLRALNKTYADTFVAIHGGALLINNATIPLTLDGMNESYVIEWNR